MQFSEILIYITGIYLTKLKFVHSFYLANKYTGPEYFAQFNSKFREFDIILLTTGMLSKV